jgi:hypothetical protein
MNLVCSRFDASSFVDQLPLAALPAGNGTECSISLVRRVYWTLLLADECGHGPHADAQQAYAGRIAHQAADLILQGLALLGGPDLVNTAAPAVGTAPSPQARDSGLIPHWNGMLLYYDGELVKRFRVPASFQRIALNAFQGAGWPRRIPDPFPWDEDVDPRDRLHNVVTSLNRQITPLLDFYRDGTGHGLCWKPREPR